MKARLSALACAAIFAACGGGGDGGDTTAQASSLQAQLQALDAQVMAGTLSLDDAQAAALRLRFEVQAKAQAAAAPTKKTAEFYVDECPYGCDTGWVGVSGNPGPLFMGPPQFPNYGVQCYVTCTLGNWFNAVRGYFSTDTVFVGRSARGDVTAEMRKYAYACQHATGLLQVEPGYGDNEGTICTGALSVPLVFGASLQSAETTVGYHPAIEPPWWDGGCGLMGCGGGGLRTNDTQ